MPVQWTKHRFSGGLLILDTTNTVVLRGDPRTFDRFADAGEIGRFAEAASANRSEELGGRSLSFEPTPAATRRVIELREAADRLFRSATEAGEIQAARLPPLLRASASCLDGVEESFGRPERPFGDPSRPLRFEAALALSALSLVSGDAWRRIKICRNCRWLFLDRSRNASRLWCDMSVCGNRRKAQRHYERRKDAGREVAHA